MIIKDNDVFPQVKEITIEKHDDFRGYNAEIFNEDMYCDIYEGGFHTDTISRSRKGVLRGLHGDFRTWKLVQCLYGTIFFAVVNIDSSNQMSYLRHFTTTLSDTNGKQILIPPGFADGHQCMSDECIFSYKISVSYDRNSQDSYHYADPRIRIRWPIENPIISNRDYVATREVL